MRNGVRVQTKPFISITDFTDFSQVREMQKILERTGSSRKLGVGVMMSRKTLLGIPTKWASVFPKKTQIADIFQQGRNLFNVLHYADYDEQSTSREFLKAIAYTGKYLHALQLDMTWPMLDGIKEVKRRAPEIAIILQVGEVAMEKCGNDPQQVAERLVPYRATNCLDYVLLDKSMGKGKGMDAELLLTYMRAIQARLKGLALVVAGGLGPETMNLVDPIRREFPDVSIDAQSRLRPSGNATDPIDWNLAGQYLREAGKRFE